MVASRWGDRWWPNLARTRHGIECDIPRKLPALNVAPTIGRIISSELAMSANRLRTVSTALTENGKIGVFRELTALYTPRRSAQGPCGVSLLGDRQMMIYP